MATMKPREYKKPSSEPPVRHVHRPGRFPRACVQALGPDSSTPPLAARGSDWPGHPGIPAAPLPRLTYPPGNPQGEPPAPAAPDGPQARAAPMRPRSATRNELRVPAPDPQAIRVRHHRADDSSPAGQSWTRPSSPTCCPSSARSSGDYLRTRSGHSHGRRQRGRCASGAGSACSGAWCRLRMNSAGSCVTWYRRVCAVQGKGAAAAITCPAVLFRPRGLPKVEMEYHQRRPVHGKPEGGEPRGMDARPDGQDLASGDARPKHPLPGSRMVGTHRQPHARQTRSLVGAAAGPAIGAAGR